MTAIIVIRRKVNKSQGMTENVSGILEQFLAVMKDMKL